MDLSVRPGDDFYDYATLGWRNANPIPDDYSRYGALDKLRNENLERVHKIAQNNRGKIGQLYKIAMDEDKLNADGVAPLKPWFDKIDAIESVSQLPELFAQLRPITYTFFSDGVTLDRMNSEYYIYTIGTGSTGLSRDYYFDTDKKSVEIRTKYKKYMSDIFDNFGIRGDVEQLYKLEERMAKTFYKKEKLRDPYATYHKITAHELKKKFPGFDWKAYFKTRDISINELNVTQPESITEMLKILNDTDLELIKTYLKYCVATDSTGILDYKTYNISWDFYNRVLSGQKEQKPRWKRVVGLLNGSLGEEIGRLYVDKYFPAAAKERMEQLVKNLQSAYAIRIKNLDWMSNDTKTKALEKLETFQAKIGYPDKWRDYSKLEIKNDSLFENMMRVSEFEDRFWLQKIGGKVDRSLWLMNAHAVNAYYSPLTNEICFPAGILQYPFFDMKADDAFNYGAIGSVIGHEMTHGFDDSGRKFDKDGNLKDWWTKADAAAFEKHTKVMRDFFDKITVFPGIKANGTFTLGENLADYGGVTISFTAYKNYGLVADIDSDFSPEQRFFLSYAGVWGQNIRDEEIQRLTKMDEHSLGRWRVNGILPHIDFWYDAFGITPKSKLYIKPENRVKIW
jgi:putative endopeptidase